MIERPLKTGAYCGVTLLIVSIISNIIIQVTTAFGIQNTFLSGFIMLIGWIELLLSMFFWYAFVVLGKKFKNRLLVVMSWISVIITILFLVFSIIGGIVNLIPKASAATNAGSSETLLTQLQASNPELFANVTPDQFQTFVTAFIISWIVISIILGIFSILFGIGLLRLGKDVKYAKASGILNIIAGATYIIIIGFFVQLASFIVEIILLFKAAKKFEK